MTGGSQIENINLTSKIMKPSSLKKSIALGAVVAALALAPNLHASGTAVEVFVEGGFTPIEALSYGFTSDRAEILPAFIRYHCENDECGALFRST